MHEMVLLGWEPEPSRLFKESALALSQIVCRPSECQHRHVQGANKCASRASLPRVGCVPRCAALQVSCVWWCALFVMCPFKRREPSTSLSVLL